MFDIFEIIDGKPLYDHQDRDLLFLILKRMHRMALDLTAVNAALAKVSTDVDALITADVSAAQAAAAVTVADQAQVDALVPSITTISAKAEAALAPPVPAPAPAV